MAGGGLLVEGLFAVGAVVADRGGAHEHRRALADSSPPRAGHPRGCGSRARGSRGSRDWCARSTAARSARPPGARRRPRPPEPPAAPVRAVGPSRWTCTCVSPAAGTPSASSARAGSRESAVTCAPSERSGASRARPSRPVAPVTVTRMPRALAGGRHPSLTWLRLDGGVAAGGVRAGGGVALREPDLLPGLRHAGGARLLGHGRGDRGGDVAVEHGGDDVVLAQLLVGDDRGDRAGGGHLHLLGDGRCAHVQGAAENAGEAEHVVDLVGVVRAARGHDPHVRGGLLGDDLGVGVGHREHHRVVVHARQRLRGQRARAGDADQQIGALDHVRRRARAALRVGRPPRTSA